MISHMLCNDDQTESETVEMNNRIPGPQPGENTPPHQTHQTQNGCTDKEEMNRTETPLETIPPNNSEKQQVHTIDGDFTGILAKREELCNNGIDEQPYTTLMSNEHPFQKEDNSEDGEEASELFPDSPLSEQSDDVQDSDDIPSDVSMNGSLQEITTCESFVDNNALKHLSTDMIDTCHKAAKKSAPWDCYNQVVPLALNPRGSLLELAQKLRVANEKMWGCDSSNSSVAANTTKAHKPVVGNSMVYQHDQQHVSDMAATPNVDTPEKTDTDSTMNNLLLKEKITAVGNQLWKVLLHIDPNESDTVAPPPLNSPLRGPSLWPVLAATRDNPMLDYAELMNSFASRPNVSESRTSATEQQISSGLTPPLPLNDSQIENIESNAIDFVVKTKIPKLYAKKTAGEMKHVSKKVVVPQDFLPRKHKCQLCNYQTDNKSHLRRHQSSVHSAVKPYFCYICNKDFSRTEKVKAHFLKMHVSIVYDPKLCRRNALPPSELSGRHRDSAGKFISTSKLYPEGSECNPVGSPASSLIMSSPVSSLLLTAPELKAVQVYQSLVEDSQKMVVSSPSAHASLGLVDVSETGSSYTAARLLGKKCPHCTYISRDMWHLKRHLSDVHSQQKAFSCPICCYSTSRRHRLVTHMSAHTMLYCLYCAFNTDDLNAFTAHQHACTQQYSATTFTCMFCGEQCAGKTQLQDHASSVHQSQFYICQSCPFFTGNAAVFDSHKLQHNSGGVNKHCTETFLASTKRSATSPQQHSPPKRASKGNVGFFSCPHCDFTSKYRNVLRKHLTKHPGEVYVCNMMNCDYRTTDKSLLQQHTHGQHGQQVETQSYPCPMCLRPPFKYKRSLEKHIQMHMETDEKCQQCGARFLLKAQLDRHMETEHKTPEVDVTSDDDDDASSDSSHLDEVDDTCGSVAFPVPQFDEQVGSLPTVVGEILSTAKSSTEGANGGS
ncbi:hypothetical protein LSAT2_030674 [Lamellibrachia satsuma]|nr:hypothetical protein LSAT2_030674 [Lamellibrachia satsuma]